MAPLHRLGDEASARRHLAHLLGAHHQDQVVLPRRDRERRVPHGLHPRGAVGRHARDRDRREAERVADEGAGVALVPVEEGLVGPEPPGLELPGLHPGVAHGERRGLVDHVGVRLVEVLPESDVPVPMIATWLASPMRPPAPPARTSPPAPRVVTPPGWSGPYCAARTPMCPARRRPDATRGRRMSAGAARVTPDFALTDAEIRALDEPGWFLRDGVLGPRRSIGIHDAVEALAAGRPAPPGGAQPGRRVSRRRRRPRRRDRVDRSGRGAPGAAPDSGPSSSRCATR